MRFNTMNRAGALLLSCCAMTFLSGWASSPPPSANTSAGFKARPIGVGDSVVKWDSVGWSGRVVVGEIYTGINCGLCQPHEMAFDSLIKRYPYSAFIPLEYHSPGCLPVNNPGDVFWYRMWNWYGDPFPGIGIKSKYTRIFPVPDPNESSRDDLIDGRGAVFSDSSGEFYEQEVRAIDAELRKAPGAVLHVEATPRGGKIVTSVQVKSIAPGHPDVYVRILVLEDTVKLRLTDTTQQSISTWGQRLNHHMVVRAASRDDKHPDKYTAGTPLHGTGTVRYTFDMAKMQKEKLYYRRIALGELEPKTKADRDWQEIFRHYGSAAAFSDVKNYGIDPTRLHVVALVQDARTAEVLQAQMVRVNTGPHGELLKLSL